MAVSNDVLWTQTPSFEPALELLKPLVDPLHPVVTQPSESHLQEFAAVIENVIVPRLLMSHVHGNHLNIQKKARLNEVGVRDFVDLTMRDDPEMATKFVKGLLNDGIPFQDILLDLMAPAARELGERWSNDAVSFVAVTLGVARMHRILREFDGVPAHLWGQTGAGHSVLLLPAPGEHHTFGLRLVQEFLLRESWNVTNHLFETDKQLGERVASESFDVVGLSLSGETLIESMRSAIGIIRMKSKNPSTKIIVGGQLFVVRPELIATSGADAYAADAPSTVTLVNSWARPTRAATT